MWGVWGRQIYGGVLKPGGITAVLGGLLGEGGCLGACMRRLQFSGGSVAYSFLLVVTDEFYDILSLWLGNRGSLRMAEVKS